VQSEVPNNHCRNCDKELAEGHAFCAYCGQKVAENELSVRQILRGFWSSMVQPVFVLVGALLVRPGSVSRDYVEGKRKRFLGPYAFLFLTVGLTSAAVALSGFQILHGKELALGTGADPLNAKAVAATNDVFQGHVNALILLETPLLAAFCRLLFRKDRISFAEHLVLASYTSGMRSLFTTIVVIPISLILFRVFGIDSAYFGMAGLAAWFVYFAFAMTPFSREHGLSAGLKGAAAAVLAWVFSQIVVSAVAMGFILYFSRG